MAKVRTLGRRTGPTSKRTDDLLVTSYLTETPWGFLGLAWTERGLCSVIFPDPSEARVEERLRERHPQAKRASRAPAWLRPIVKQLGRLLERGEALEWEEIPLDFTGITPFHEKIYREALKIPCGRVASYAELARRAGSPLAARAVGQAMARNPLPLVVPCHRVLNSGGKLGGFSAPGGLHSKERLLELEGYSLKPKLLTGDFDPQQALRELAQKDPRMGRLIKEIGPFQLKLASDRSPYQWLMRSIIYQQLNGRAAQTIHERVRSVFGGRDPHPEELLKTADEDLLKAGLSKNKLLALRDLARHASEGKVPDRRKLARMADEEIIERLTSIRGVGRWTVEMMLIFGLGRADVLAVDDFALKKATMQLHNLPEMPQRKAFQAIGEVWRPWRSVASWYLWRSLDPKLVT